MGRLAIVVSALGILVVLSGCKSAEWEKRYLKKEEENRALKEAFDVQNERIAEKDAAAEQLRREMDDTQAEIDALAAELGVADQGLLDPAARELLLDGERIPLTPLEFGVIALLESRGGEAVSRDELLRQVWGHGHAGGSNVVDAVVRGLRRKCGDCASMLETVRGVGYRLKL